MGFLFLSFLFLGSSLLSLLSPVENKHLLQLRCPAARLRKSPTGLASGYHGTAAAGSILYQDALRKSLQLIKVHVPAAARRPVWR